MVHQNSFLRSTFLNIQATQGTDEIHEGLMQETRDILERYMYINFI